MEPRNLIHAMASTVQDLYEVAPSKKVGKVSIYHKLARFPGYQLEICLQKMDPTYKIL